MIGPEEREGVRINRRHINFTIQKGASDNHIGLWKRETGSEVRYPDDHP